MLSERIQNALKKANLQLWLVKGRDLPPAYKEQLLLRKLSPRVYTGIVFNNKDTLISTLTTLCTMWGITVRDIYEAV